MRFDITTLSLVHAIAQTRSITRGAAREHLALAAASKRVADLECRLGVQLFVRKARGVEITKAGEALVRHIRSLQDTLNALETEIAQFANGVKGKLRVGATAGVIAEWLPADLAAFSRRYPGIQLSLEEMTSAEGVRAVAEESIDVGIFSLSSPDARVDSWDYRQGRLALLVPPGHLLETYRQASAEDLLNQTLILHSATHRAHEVLAEAAEKRGMELAVRCYAKEADAVAQLVQQGLGVAIVPESVAQRLSQSYRTKVVKLSGDWAAMDYSLCVQRRTQLPVVTQRFIDALVHKPALARELKAA